MRRALGLVRFRGLAFLFLVTLFRFASKTISESMMSPGISSVSVFFRRYVEGIASPREQVSIGSLIQRRRIERLAVVADAEAAEDERVHAVTDAADRAVAQEAVHAGKMGAAELAQAAAAEIAARDVVGR